MSGGETIYLLGYPLHPMTKEEVIDRIASSIASKQRSIIANLNLHGMAVLFKSPGMVHFLSQFNAKIIVDSMPLILLARLLSKKVRPDQRVTSLDYFDDLFRRSEKEGWKVDYVGSTEFVLVQGISALRRRFPRLDIEGENGYFDVTDRQPGSRQEAILGWLRRRDADILLVGMGMPKQEEWLDEIQDEIPCRVLIPVGAYLDFQVGAQVLPPRLLGQIGLEWLFRLVTAPKHLAFRYLAEPFVLVWRLIGKEHPFAKHRAASISTET